MAYIVPPPRSDLGLTDVWSPGRNPYQIPSIGPTVPGPWPQGQNRQGDKWPGYTPPSFVSTDGGGSPASGSSAPPVAATSEGGRFAALRGFLAANADTAQQQALPVAQGIEAQAQDAMRKSAELGNPANVDNRQDLSASARSARDATIDRLNAANSDASAQVFNRTPDARYSQGEQAADSALFGRTQAFRDLSRWQPLVSSLDASYKVQDQVQGTQPAKVPAKPKEPRLWFGPRSES